MEEDNKKEATGKKYDLLLTKIEEQKEHSERIAYIKLLDQSISFEAEVFDSIYNGKVEEIHKSYIENREKLKEDNEDGSKEDELFTSELMEWLEVYAEIKKLLWRIGYYVGNPWDKQ